MDPHYQSARDLQLIVDQLFGRKQNWAISFASGHDRGKREQASGLAWLGESLVNIEWLALRHSILEIVAARTPCGEPVKPELLSRAILHSQLPCRAQT